MFHNILINNKLELFASYLINPGLIFTAFSLVLTSMVLKRCHKLRYVCSLCNSLMVMLKKYMYFFRYSQIHKNIQRLWKNTMVMMSSKQLRRDKCHHHLCKSYVSFKSFNQSYAVYSTSICIFPICSL